MDHVSGIVDNILATDSHGGSENMELKSADKTDISPMNNNESNDKPNDKSNDKSNNDEKPKRLSDIGFSWFFPSDESKDEEVSINGSGSILTDKLFETFLSFMAPIDENDLELNKILKERLKMQKKRPPLSYATMSKNTTLLNSRLSSMFIFIDNVINFFNWTNPYYTIAIQIAATHIVLNPYLFLVLPIILVIGNILIPHYLIVYPPEQTILSYINQNPIPSFNQLEKYKTPQPVNQFSREFYMNLTDLQNFQVLHVEIWDFFVWLTNDYLYFRNENLSSVFCLILLFFIPINLYFLPKIIPYLFDNVFIIKTYCLVLIWSVPILLHPQVRAVALEWICREDTRLNTQNAINHIELYLCSFLVRHEDKIQVKDTEDFDVNEVEIFELQKFDPETKIWNLRGFSNSFYTINTAIRKYNLDLKQDKTILEDQKPYYIIHKKLSIEEVNPPPGWKFIESKWSLDLKVRDWVEYNLIQDLVSIDDDEKWVYDYNNQENIDKNISIYRRRRWIRTCRRETYLDREAKEREKEIQSSISNWEFK